jgi:hypothetical protein
MWAKLIRSCVIIMSAATLSLTAQFALAADAPPAGGDANSPPPVNTNTHPDALILNARNPLAIHAGPGKPNVGTIYIPPTLSGKDKGKNKSGATEQSVMGTAPAK